MNASAQLDQVIALAGLFQACELVRCTARDGPPDEEDVRTCVGSVFQIDAETVEAVYGGRDRLRSGLGILARQFGGPTEPGDAEIRRYAASLMYLERRLTKVRQDLMEGLRAGLETIGREIGTDAASHPETVARLAELYVQTISTITPQIRVFGDPARLEVTANADLIRALLMAGIRSAVLWRQVGGNRLRLLFGRRRLMVMAEALRAEMGA